ncbi:MAG: hypothetical protein RLP09_09560 [Sandaracinaceae bacterium]
MLHGPDELAAAIADYESAERLHRDAPRWLASARERRLGGAGIRRGIRGPGGGGGGAAWDPTQLTDGVHYWDPAEDVTTSSGDATAVGDLVGSVDFASTGNPPAYEASQAIFGGAPALEFNGSNESLRASRGATLSQTYTKWVVGSWTSTGLRIMWGASTPSRSIFRLNSSAGGLEMFAGGSVARATTTPTLDTAYLYVCVMVNGSAQLYINNSLQSLNTQAIGTNGATNFDWAYDGTAYGTVRIAAGGVVSGVMSADDRASLLAWAQANKGVA